MEFKPLFFQDKLTIINPRGTVGLVTLWSRVDYVLARCRQAGVDLNPETSPIAACGTLYGNGLRELLRNLLYNPQIRFLVFCGRNRSQSKEELQAFFTAGLEESSSPLLSFAPGPDGQPVTTCRIRGTRRLIDNLVRPEHFQLPPVLVDLGDPQEDECLARLATFFARPLPPVDPATLPPRLAIPLPQPRIAYFPSNPRGQVIVRRRPLEAWRELLFVLLRFGQPVTLAKGRRLELQNVKVVVEEPVFEAEADLQACHLDPEHLRRYQAEILRGELRPDETYSYGHRLRAYFGQDNLDFCRQRLLADPEDRKAYVTLWDNQRDLTVSRGQPCFVSLFCRRFGGRLTLTATFRTHNALDAWLPNFYGLMAIRDYLAEQVGLPGGAITVISHSISLDPREMDRALELIRLRSFVLQEDPCGYFRISLDGPEILVEHRYGDITLKEYRGTRAVQLQHQIVRDLAVSDLNHALYLGRQLARAEECLRTGRPFEQE